jgi:hypothetical protein
MAGIELVQSNSLPRLVRVKGLADRCFARSLKYASRSVPATKTKPTVSEDGENHTSIAQRTESGTGKATKQGCTGGSGVGFGVWCGDET